MAGTEWIVDAEGCAAEALRDPALLAGLCGAVVRDLGLKVLGEPRWHRFPEPGGVTGIYLLTESHLACHTYPELGVATFNLYSCRARPRWPWRSRLRAALGARAVRVRALRRGAAEAALAAPAPATAGLRGGAGRGAAP
ncbi:MAG: S-adenosylmethionine decarboxylase [Planctomycetes bacterium]|nr:S-adenosylmethionine decarboxylase [Planctomycetota bacterium]